MLTDMSSTAVVEPPAREDQLLAADTRVALEAHRLIAEPLVARLEGDLPRALEGSRVAIRSYVTTWRELKQVTLQAIRRVRPELVGLVGSQPALLDASGAPSLLVDEALDLAAIHAPLSPWVAAYGLGTGTAGALLAEVRSYLAGVPALEPPATATFPHIGADRARLERFARLVLEELSAGKTALERVAEILDLTLTDLGRLFGVRRQAILQWVDAGVPAARQGKLGTVLAIAELLERKLRAGRVPLAARRPADAYGGRTMLEMIEADRQEELYRSVRGSFDWSATA